MIYLKAIESCTRMRHREWGLVLHNEIQMDLKENGFKMNLKIANAFIQFHGIMDDPGQINLIYSQFICGSFIGNQF